MFVQGHGHEPAAELAPILARFLPPAAPGTGSDPVRFVQDLIRSISANRSSISAYAATAFIWFSTRLFASVRSGLNRIYRFAAPAHPDRHFLVRFLLNKGWDIVMVGALLTLFVANILVGAALAAAEAWSAAQIPGAAGSVSYLGRLLAVSLQFVFAFTVFTVIYRYGAVRRVRWMTAALAATFSALAVEVAKRLFGLYLIAASGTHGIAAWGSFTSVALFVLWAYYTAVVFLLGGVVAEVWAERAQLKIVTGTHAVPAP
jgi:YihY family inner membrane protein